MSGQPSLHGHAHLGDGERFVGVFLHEGGWEGEGAEGRAVDEWVLRLVMRWRDPLSPWQRPVAFTRPV